MAGRRCTPASPRVPRQPRATSWPSIPGLSRILGGNTLLSSATQAHRLPAIRLLGGSETGNTWEGAPLLEGMPALGQIRGLRGAGFQGLGLGASVTEDGLRAGLVSGAFRPDPWLPEPSCRQGRCTGPGSLDDRKGPRGRPLATMTRRDQSPGPQPRTGRHLLPLVLGNVPVWSLAAPHPG